MKKTLYDLWDNMFKIVVTNLGFYIVTAIPVFLPALSAKFIDSKPLEMILFAFGVFLCFLYLSATAFSVKTISDNSSFSFADFIGNLKPALLPALALFCFTLIIALVVMIVIPFYFSMDSIFGMIPGMIIIWALFFAVISFQFYFTVYIRLGKKIFKSFKKCLLISFDNTSLMIFSLFHNVAVMLLSILFILMFPGPAGVLLYLDEALRLRLLKYDWLEENPSADRRKIPWDALLIEEREKAGNRTLKNFIFPWKD